MRFDLRRFTDLSFIQSVDKPRFLAPLLKPHTEYFARQGLDVLNLSNDDRTDRALHKVFTRPDEETPPALLHRLYLIDDLADDAGRDRLIEEARKRGQSLDGIIGKDLSAGDFALAAYQLHPGLLLECHDRLIVRKVKNFVEFQSKTATSLRLRDAESKLRPLEREMAPWFAAHDREEICEVDVFEEREELKFSVTHGQPFHVQPTFDKKKQRSRTGLRPQKQDSVVVDMRTGILRVSGQTQNEKELYRRAFGKVCFGDPEQFPAGNLYTLAPLKRVGELALAAGIDAARLTEVWIDFDDANQFLQISRAQDLLLASRSTGAPDIRKGKPIRAAFLIRYKSGGRARKLELRPPNIAVYDRDRDGEPTEAFLRANGLRKSDA